MNKLKEPLMPEIIEKIQVLLDEIWEPQYVYVNMMLDPQEKFFTAYGTEEEIQASHKCLQDFICRVLPKLTLLQRQNILNCIVSCFETVGVEICQQKQDRSIRFICDQCQTLNHCLDIFMGSAMKKRLANLEVEVKKTHRKLKKG